MDLQQAFDEGFDALKGYVDRSFDAYAKRIEALESRMTSLPRPEVGKADITAIVADVESLRKAVSEWKMPEPAVIPDVQALVDEAFSKVHIPDAVDIRALGKMVDDAVAAIPPAQPGKDADPEEMRREIAEQVKAAVAAIPVPKDGDSVTVDDVRPLIDEQVAKAVAAIPVPKDGADVAGGTINREGHLIITLSNGQTKDFGLVVGRDGDDVDMAAIERSITEKVAAIPRPKDGLDGIGFDDMDFEVREDGCYIVFIKGEIEKEARIPIPIDRGVYKEGQTYRKGDGVTWGGSFWFAQEETTEKPDSGKGWRLAIKKGRDGKDADGNSPTKPVKAK